MSPLRTVLQVDADCIYPQPLPGGRRHPHALAQEARQILANMPVYSVQLETEARRRRTACVGQCDVWRVAMQWKLFSPAFDITRRRILGYLHKPDEALVKWIVGALGHIQSLVRVVFRAHSALSDPGRGRSSSTRWRQPLCLKLSRHVRKVNSVVHVCRRGQVARVRWRG